MSDTYSASIAVGGRCELVVLRENGDIVFGPVDLGVPEAIARDAADAEIDRDGWKRTSNWDSDLGEYYADVEPKKAASEPAPEAAGTETPDA